MHDTIKLLGSAVLAVAILVACSEASSSAQPGDTRSQPSSQQAETTGSKDAPPQDLVTAARGARLVSASYDERRALALIDGDTKSNWNTPPTRNPGPYVFVVELMSPAQLTSVGIDGSGPRPGGVVGGSAGSVTIEGSSSGPEEGYRKLATINADAEGETVAKVAEAEKVRWLRYTIEGPGNADANYVYLDELVAYGSLEEVESEGRFTGIFQTGRADYIRLEQDGALISGCYIENSGRSAGRIEGSLVDGVALLNWRSDQGITGTALLTRTAQGGLDGLRYRQRSRSQWSGPMVEEAGEEIRCEDESSTNPVTQALEEDGIARLYGIHFEYDSDVPKPSARAALDQLYEALAEDESLVVVIEGHTDSDGSEDYNSDLSDRRAKAVMNDMTERGIAASRLSAVGKGESEPVASNDTADGRALNRRVEVRKES